ncbi:MAG: right-handed parallel beta-helix repeat-containing protein [Candidatus Eisenbacteria bacterium]
MRRSSSLALLACLFVLPVASPGVASGTILNVPESYPTISQAIDFAAEGDTVLVAPGTYYENLQFRGVDIVLLSSGGMEVTTIDGGTNGPTIVIDQGEGRGLVVEGFTITGGQYVLQIDQRGIVIRDSSPTIRHNWIRDNCTGDITQALGAGIYAGGASSPCIENNLIESNIAYQTLLIPAGGGIYLESYLPLPFPARIVGNVIRDNRVTGSFEVSGGGVYVEVAVPTDCVFEGNEVTGNRAAAESAGSASGGGIYANCDLRNCVVSGNVATGGKAYGGGVLSLSPGMCEGLVVEANEVHANNLSYPTATGGGIKSNSQVIGCVIAGNRAAVQDLPGGLRSWSMSKGGGVLFTGTRLEGCTIAGNVSGGGTDQNWGAGLCIEAAGAMVSRCILSGNRFETPGQGSGVAGSPASFACNDVWDNDGDDFYGFPDPCGQDGNFSADPIFCPVEPPDYTLRDDSPCAPGNHPGGWDCETIGARGVACVAAGAADAGVAGRFDLRLLPIPARETVEMELTLPRAADLRVEVFTVDGARVATVLDGPREPGVVHASWDGLLSGGRRAAPGVYWVRADAGGEVRTGKVVLAR